MKKFLVLSMFLGVMFAGEVDRTVIYNKDGLKLIQEFTKPDPVIVEKIVTKVVEKIITQQVIVRDDNALNDCILSIENMGYELDVMNKENTSLVTGLEIVQRKVNEAKVAIDKQVEMANEGKENIVDQHLCPKDECSPYIPFILGVIIGIIVF